MTAPVPTAALWRARWQRFSVAAVRAFHAYATWLVGISWRRFIALSVLLLVVMGILHDLPPFTWTVTERIEDSDRRADPPARPAPPQPPRLAVPPAPPAPAATPASSSPSIRIDGDKPGGGADIRIGRDGVRITPRLRAAEQAATSAGLAADEARRAVDVAASAAEQGIRAAVPTGQMSERDIRTAVEDVRRQVQESIREAREAAEEAQRDAAQAQRDAAEAVREAAQAVAEVTRSEARQARRTRTTRFGIGDLLMQFTVLWVLGSAIIKFTYKGRMQAEVKAAQATETAESESLKRQVVEARMAAMQAQVEPHFLFNTLASIDHLIETDPPRASQMQKNLIALLRASMPTMRETSGNGAGAGGSNGVRDLGREIAVIRPYLEILKVRMEERLSTDIAVPDGLLSAEFPPMMLQTLVENAIKHGLEPKPEGGQLRVAAEIVHGKLQMTVADTGLGFGKAGSSGSTAGTGVGLVNIRERLQLLYGPKASLTVAENRPSGTVVTITVPYKTIEGAAA